MHHPCGAFHISRCCSYRFGTKKMCVYTRQEIQHIWNNMLFFAVFFFSYSARRQRVAMHGRNQVWWFIYTKVTATVAAGALYLYTHFLLVRRRGTSKQHSFTAIFLCRTLYICMPCCLLYTAGVHAAGPSLFSFRSGLKCHQVSVNMPSPILVGRHFH